MKIARQAFVKNLIGAGTGVRIKPSLALNGIFQVILLYLAARYLNARYMKPLLDQ
jgi:hypothetical protein